MVFCWLQMQKHLPDEDRCIEAIAGIIQRRLWAYKSPQEPVTLTDEDVTKIAIKHAGSAYAPPNDVTKGVFVFNVQELRGFTAALREKGGA
jgi:hypothetical protein